MARGIPFRAIPLVALISLTSAWADGPATTREFEIRGDRA